MLYAASVSKRNSSGVWLLVNDEIFEDDRHQDPIIYVKSSRKKIKKAVQGALTKARDNGEILRIWSQGQGIRFIDLNEVTSIKIISLEPKYTPISADDIIGFYP